ncbi:hypothetical protein BSKO_08344 [Bryopsis sp. KO-2023]|nr:hypothetical protein BSKO_08344 [Bryopsis sp. KO-2023]
MTRSTLLAEIATSEKEVERAGGKEDELADGPPTRWWHLGVLLVGMLLSMSTWFSASAVLPKLKETYDIGETTGSFLTIAVQIGFVVGSFFSAVTNLPDVLTPKVMMLLGATGACVANALLVIEGLPFAGAIAARGATGAFLAGVYPSGMKAASTWFKRGRGLAMGLLVGALSAGSALPFMLKALGTDSHKVVILGTSSATLTGGLFVMALFQNGPFALKSVVFDARALPRLMKDKATGLAVLGYFGHMWELYAMWAWYSSFSEDLLSKVHNKGTVSEIRSEAAWLTFAVLGTGFFGCAFGGYISDRWGRTKWSALCMLISGTCSIVVGPSRSGPLGVTVLISLIWGFFVVADSAQFSAMVTEVCEQRYIGTALTAQLASGFSLTVLTIFLIPYLLDEGVTYRWVFGILAFGPFLGVLAMFLLYHSAARSKIASGKG